MPKTINLKKNSSTFFKSKMMNEVKAKTQECLKLLKVDNSIYVDSPMQLMDFEGESELETTVPHNFYDNRALEEASRGPSYAIFPELQENIASRQPVTLFDIKTSFASRGVLDHFLQDRVINLILQCRGAIHFGIATPAQELLVQKEHVIAPKTEHATLVAEVKNEGLIVIKISIPMQVPPVSRSGPEVVGVIDCSLNITRSSIYLDEMKYTRISDSPKAKEIYNALTEDVRFFSQLWSSLKRLFGLVEREEEYELSLSSPIPAA